MASTTVKFHDLLSSAHDSLGQVHVEESGLAPNEARKLNTSGFFKFMTSAPLVAADRLSIPGSRALAHLDSKFMNALAGGEVEQEIVNEAGERELMVQYVPGKYENGVLSAMLRTLVVVLSAIQRSVVFAATFLLVGAGCIVASPVIAGYYTVVAICNYLAERAADAAAAKASAFEFV